MRYIIPAFAAVVLALSPVAGHAQTASPAPSTTEATPAPAPVAAPAPSKGRAHKMEQRFAAANTTNDGHLTLDQAKTAKWGVVVKHFAEIDTTHKGYVTQDDIKAAAQAHRAAKQTRPASNG